jgi:hypothetical protein
MRVGAFVVLLSSVGFISACGDAVGNVVVARGGGGAPTGGTAAFIDAGSGGAGGFFGFGGIGGDCRTINCRTTRPPACLGDRDCPFDAPYCDSTLGACVECRNSADCPSAAPFCHPSRRACVECLTSTDCRDTTEACNEFGHCVTPCSSDAFCTSVGKLYCEPNSRSCIECQTDVDCRNPETPVCARFGLCVY